MPNEYVKLKLMGSTTTQQLGSLKKFQNGQDDVVDVAESRGLWFLGMMEPSSPVYCYIRVLFVQLHRSSCNDMHLIDAFKVLFNIFHILSTEEEN